MSSKNSSLRPGWFKGSGAGGGKGFQPPPTASDRGEKGRSNSQGSSDNDGARRDANIFAALLDDEDGATSGVGDSNGVVHASESSSKPPPVISSSRSEAFRSSFNRTSSTGSRRSLADLAARVPESSSTGHGSRRLHHSSGSGRFSHMHDSGSMGGSIESYKPDPKVIRYTREKLLSLRFAPRGEDPGPPEELKSLEGSVILSATAQDPVCWDTFDAEGIWEVVREQRRSSTGGKSLGGLEDQRRRTAPSTGRWSRGLALPPPEDSSRRKGEAENPNELWDDPVGGVMGAASDFSAFGALPPDGDVFDFDKMAEASAKLEKELHGEKDNDDETDYNASKKVDVSRPLASAGTTLVSGSGNDVNVFEDFDTPLASDNEGENKITAKEETNTAAVRGGDENPNASSRLMKMIGVTREPSSDTGSLETKPTEPSSNPWGSSTISTDATSGAAASLSLNPWGNSIGQAPSSSQQTTSTGGMNLGGIHLGPFGADANSREAQIAAEREKLARQEAEMLARRRREEEEEQRRLLAQQQQQRQQAPQQSQIELVLMERICTILENSWGRSDLMTILRTLHTEDSRVIPLLGNIDALRALIARSPQRVSLRRDPGIAGEIAVLVLTNNQWQEQQQMRARMQQEELRRRQMEEAKARLQAQSQLAATIKKDAPWYYSDPQNNIQGPFRGEEMRQWLEAGYFKGDLPISQVAGGPFHQLSNWFPDLNTAFTAKAMEGAMDDDAAVKEQQEKDAQAAAEAERQRIAEEMEAKRKAEELEAAAQREAEEAAARERELQATRQKEAEVRASVGSGNQSSNQLKMMLGLSSGEQQAPEKKVPEVANATKSAKKVEKKAPKPSTKKSASKPTEATDGGAPQVETIVQPVSEPTPTPAPAVPAAPAWGGVANNKPRKSMSEIQQEEARAAAALAAKRGSMQQSSSSGWANVAAGSSGWSSGTIRTASTHNSQPVTSVRPGQAPSKPQTKKVAAMTQNNRSTSTASSTPAEEFGASMSASMEKWCKDKMQQINGSDDLTLVAFCMTLNDASEIRQYLTTYLGSTSQVNNFATEFINKRGLGNKQEEWETPGSAKKGRKKKSGR